MPLLKNKKKAHKAKNRSPKAPVTVQKPVNAKIVYGDHNTIECALPEVSPAALSAIIRKKFNIPRSATLVYPSGAEYVVNWDMTLKRTVVKIESAHD